MKLQTNKVFRLLKNSDTRITSMRGGTRSGKTYNILIFLIVLAMQSQGLIITIARQTMPALRASAMRDFFEILHSIELYSEANHNKTNNEYVLNGNIFEFIGVKESERVRGRKRDILFFNEANEGDLESFRQLAFRTKEKIILDYNPSDMHSWIYEHVEMRSDCELFVTTYRDNPFLEKSIVEEIERLKDSDEDYWKVYGLGEIANISNIVYTHWRTIHNGEYPFGRGDNAYGLDFGYNNATALTETKLYDDVLYWRELLYQTKLTNADLIEKLKEIPEIAAGGLIVADSAEPQRIEEISRAGFSIIGANKSVKDGIDFVKSKPLRIHEWSANLSREIKRYTWKTDKNGHILDEVIKFDDHALDAGRYGSMKLHEPTASFGGFESGIPYSQHGI